MNGTVFTDGSASETWINGNSGVQLYCLNGGALHSLGNNQMKIGVVCATYTVGGGV